MPTLSKEEGHDTHLDILRHGGEVILPRISLLPEQDQGSDLDILRHGGGQPVVVAQQVGQTGQHGHRRKRQVVTAAKTSQKFLQRPITWSKNIRKNACKNPCKNTCTIFFPSNCDNPLITEYLRQQILHQAAIRASSDVLESDHSLMQQKNCHESLRVFLHVLLLHVIGRLDR